MHILTKRGLLLVCAILTCFFSGLAQAQGDVDVPLARDLVVEAQVSQTRRLPLMILFMSPQCPYCDQVLRDFLLPMQRNPEYRNKVIVRQIDIGSDNRLRDFSGHIISHSAFASQHKIRMVPTVKLFNAQGQELTQPLVGLLTPDFYGGYLDQVIDEALVKLRNTNSKNFGSAAVFVRASR